MALAALVAVAGAGCGDGDDAPTKAEFIEQADAICQKSNRQRIAASEKLFNEHNGLPPREAEEDFIIEKGVPLIREQLEKLSALDSPDGEEDEVKAMLAAFETAVEKVEAQPTGAVTRGLQDFKRFEQMAIAYGFDECAAI